MISPNGLYGHVPLPMPLNLSWQHGFLSASLQIVFADEHYDCLLFGPYIVS